MFQKQNTAARRYFYLESAFNTPVTGQTVNVQIMKAGASSFSDPNAGSTNLTEVSNGWYFLDPANADVDTLGALNYKLSWNAGASVTGREDQVVLDLPGGAVSSVTGNVGGSVASVTGNVGGSVASVSGNVGGSVASCGSVTGQVDIGKILGSSIAAQAAQRFWDGVEQGGAQGGASTTITLRSSASSVDDFYKDMAVVIVSGPGTGQVRKISGYVGSTKVATVSAAWLTNPDNTSIYELLGRIE